jgi:exodeoxyribonuclease V alpha subunit
VPAIRQEAVKISGELIAFRAVGSDGWGIGTVAAGGGERLGVTGKLVGVQVGQTVELEGSWVDSERFGRQLKVRTCTSTVPQSDDGVVAWLASTLPDVGVGRARALVARFRGELWQVIEHEPSTLTRVDGITPQRAEAIHAAYMLHRADRDHMIALRGFGLTDSQIARCLAQWRTLASVIEHIRENAYQLSDYVYGFGFVRADAVAIKAGLKFDSPFRIAAGIEHVLAEACDDAGHCFLPFGRLQAQTVKLLGVDPPLVSTAMRAAIRAGRLVTHGPRLYTRRMDAAEETCTRAMRVILSRTRAA